MKRWLALFLLCCVLLIAPVQAAGIESWNVDAAVSTNGDTRMSVRLVIRLDAPVTKLVFPLGDGARDLTVNGVALRVRRSNGVPSAVLESDSGFSGALQFDMTYTLRGCLNPEQNWDLVLPLLADGLEYSVESISFKITLPAGTEALPGFSSGYRQDDVDNYISYDMDGTVISGSVNTTMRDHENLVFTIATDPEVYPRTGVGGQNAAWMAAMALAFFLLAVVYWFFFLRWKAFRVIPQTQAPVGLNPGQVGCQLLTQSPDLALMILSWAQAGYVTIYMDRYMAVTLHKRMSMGNECDRYEWDIFERLFGRGQMVECASHKFQALRIKVDHDRPRVKRQFARGGNLLIPRVLGCLSSAMVWAAMADSLMGAGIVKWIVLALMAVVGIVTAWMIHDGLKSILSWNRRPGMLALLCCALTLVTGIVSGCILMAVLSILAHGALSLLILFGPRRSEAGRTTVQSILGLRKYLRTMSHKQINRIIQTDPGYYYNMAPYALALGVDRAFAKRFAQVQLGDCPWLITEQPPTGSAQRWYHILRQVTRSIRGKLPQAAAVPSRKGGRTRV